MKKVWQICHKLIHGKRRRKRDNVNSCQRSHARRRYEERFDAELTQEDYAAVIEDVKAEKGYLLEDASNGDGFVGVWCIEIHGEDVVVFYDKDTEQIRTFFTLEMWEERLNRRSDQEDVYAS